MFCGLGEIDQEIMKRYNLERLYPVETMNKAYKIKYITFVK